MIKMMEEVFPSKMGYGFLEGEGANQDGSPKRKKVYPEMGSSNCRPTKKKEWEETEFNTGGIRGVAQNGKIKKKKTEGEFHFWVGTIFGGGEKQKRGYWGGIKKRGRNTAPVENRKNVLPQIMKEGKKNHQRDDYTLGPKARDTCNIQEATKRGEKL